MKTHPTNNSKPTFTGPLGKKELAKLLGVSLFILNKWLKAIANELGKPVGFKYSINQVRYIVAKYGSLSEFDTSEFGARLDLSNATYSGTLVVKAEIIERLKKHPDIRLGNYIH
ncbi:MAG: hypothetical protein IT236_03600 [Bacteroidia bacterium]|nr:hypothetical protein [Bacteroidia bacterium]